MGMKGRDGDQGEGWAEGSEGRVWKWGWGSGGSGGAGAAAGGRETALGGRCRNNGALPAASPRPGGASSRPAGPGRGAGTAPGSARAAAAPPAERTPTPLTLSDHGFEADGCHGAARVVGLRASSRDARRHRRLPGSARTAGRSPPPRSRSRDRPMLRLRAGAPLQSERGGRPAGVSARGRGRPGAGLRARRQRPPRGCANRTAARGLGPALRDAAGREAASGWSGSRAHPLASRAARPRLPRAPRAPGPRVPSAASAPGPPATGC